MRNENDQNESEVNLNECEHVLNRSIFCKKKTSTFYIKVFASNRQNIVVRCYENARNTF